MRHFHGLALLERDRPVETSGREPIPVPKPEELPKKRCCGGSIACQCDLRTCKCTCDGCPACPAD